MSTPSGTSSNGHFSLLRGNYNRPHNESRRYGQIIRNSENYRPSVAHDETSISCTAYGVKTVTREERPVTPDTILSSCDLDDKKQD